MAHMLQQETKLVHPAKCPYSTSKIACSRSKKWSVDCLSEVWLLKLKAIQVRRSCLCVVF